MNETLPADPHLQVAEAHLRTVVAEQAARIEELAAEVLRLRLALDGRPFGWDAEEKK